MKIAALYEKLPGPAQRALAGLRLSKVEDLAKHTRTSVAGLHGIGPSAMRIIEEELVCLDLAFKSEGRIKGKPEGKTAGPSAMMGSDATTIDEYIKVFPKATRDRLAEIRKIIREEAPEASEKIAYRMPTFVLGGNLIHFAGYERHIGIYPTPSGIEAFKAELDAYKNAKGSVQFPLDEPLPTDLIRRIVRFRVEETARKAAAKKARR